MLSDRLPVTCTLMGLGAFPAPHEQWLGMLGMHGTRTANYAMDEADLIVAVGARFDDRITGKLAEFAPRAKFVHIDIDPAEISKNVPAHIPIVGDAKNVLARLTNEYRALGPDPARLAGWWERIEQWRAQYPLRYDDSPDTEIKPQYLVAGALRGDGRRLHPVLGRRPAPDVGRAVLPLRQAPPLDQLRRPRARWASACRPRWAPPSATPTVPSVLLTGDGSFQMNSQELATCREHDIPVKVVIMNNGYLGMVRQWQELFWDRRYSNVDMGSWPDWVKLAEAYGATGVRLTDKTTLVADLGSAIATPGPVVVDVRVTREENTYPMIPAGRGRAGDGRADGRARDQGAADARGARGDDGRAHRPQAHPLDPGGEQAGRAHAHRRPVRPPRLQHRHARGRADRRRRRCRASRSRSTARCTRSTRSPSSCTSSST